MLLPSLDPNKSPLDWPWPRLSTPRFQELQPAQKAVAQSPYSPFSRQESNRFSTDQSANLATASVISPAGMGTTFDVLRASQSMPGGRAPPASLPSFDAPMPPSSLAHMASNVAQRYSPFSASNPLPQVTAAAPPGNLLNPLLTSQNVGSSSSRTVVNSGGTANNDNVTNADHGGHNVPSSTGVLPYNSNQYWQANNSTSGVYNSGMPPSWQGSNSLYGNRTMFSPSMNSFVRTGDPPQATGDGHNLPPAPSQSSFDVNVLPPFQSAMRHTPTSQSADNIQQPQPQQPISSSIISSHSILPSASPSPPNHPADSNSHKSAPTTAVYESSHHSAPPQRTEFQFPPRPPVQQSPHTSAPPSISRASPQVTHTPANSGPPQTHFVRASYPQYPLPPAHGSPMTNLQSQPNHMSMVGSIQPSMMPQLNSGYPPNAQAMYASQQNQHHIVNDRPFKCEQCPQSFNRNHDLKRHRRIHLAVKPFPCKHCDKSFSRKDALKVGHQRTARG